MHIVGIIPARYASQRLAAKPLVDLLGKPMVRRVYERAQQARMLHRVIVATDDERIATVVRDFGGEAIMTSPEIQSGSDRLAAVAEETRGDVFVNIQGDEPLIAPAMIDEAVQALLDDQNAPVSTLARRIESAEELFNPSVVKVVLDRERYGLYFSRSPVPFLRDELDRDRWPERHPYYKHVGLYVFRREFLLKYPHLPTSTLERAENLEQLRILEAGYRIKVALTDFDSIPVDTPQDVDRVLELIRQQEKGSVS
jgi:3-deoxy-manno-octulosonate cytidylyltransferase (CMP-KDO synthetase)